MRRGTTNKDLLLIFATLKFTYNRQGLEKVQMKYYLFFLLRPLGEAGLLENALAKNSHALANVGLKLGLVGDGALDVGDVHLEEHAGDLAWVLEAGELTREKLHHKWVEALAKFVPQPLCFRCLPLFFDPSPFFGEPCVFRSFPRSALLCLPNPELGEVALGHDALAHWNWNLGHSFGLGWQVLRFHVRNVELGLPEVLAVSSGGDVGDAVVLDVPVEFVGVDVGLEVLFRMKDHDFELFAVAVGGRGLVNLLDELASHGEVECVLHDFSRVEKHRTRDAEHRKGELGLVC